MTKEEQRDSDITAVDYLYSRLVEATPTTRSNSEAVLISKTLLTCVKVLSKRLIELDGTLEEIGKAINHIEPCGAYERRHRRMVENRK